MLDGASLNEQLAHPVDFESAHDAHFPPVAFDSISKGDSVDYRREHSHVIALRSIESFRGHRRSSENVSSADYDNHLFSRVRKRDDFFGERMEEFDVDTVSGRTLQGFAGKFEKKTFGIGYGHVSFGKGMKWGTKNPANGIR